MTRVLVVMGLTLAIHAVDTMSYSVRVAGVQTGRLAVAFSLFNIIVLISRTANLIQAPIVGSLVDQAIAQRRSAILLGEFQLIILSATAGSILGALLIPAFVDLLGQGIKAVEGSGSVPRVLAKSLSPRRMFHVLRGLKLPRWEPVNLSLERLPRGVLLLNVLATAIYTIGVLAAIYAGALVPEYRLTASQLSGIINGLATILLTVVVDPVAALLTDQALAGSRPVTEVVAMVIWLVIGKVMGTLLGQVIFLPAASLVIFLTRLLVMRG